MRKSAVAVSAVLLLAGFFPGNGEARNRQYSLSVSPMIGIHVFEGNQPVEGNHGLKAGALASLGIGYNFDKQFGVEGVLSYSDSTTDFPLKRDVDVYGVRLDALYHFNPDGNFVPYVSAGLGALILESDNSSDEDGSINYGVGFKYFLTDALALRGDVRHLLDWNLNDVHRKREFYNNLTASAGVTLQFGGNPPAAGKVQESRGQNNPPPATVAAVAEPAPSMPTDELLIPPTPATVSVPDSDRDGVPDALDKCANTPWGTVNASGCPKDSDADGVADYLDRCPDTLAGVKIDVQGCPEIQGFKIDIEFMTASVAIDPRYHDEMQKAADYIQAQPAGQIIIEGHTDSVGRTECNDKLSIQRAEAVRQYLIDRFDIPAARLGTQGFGEMRPVANNATQDGRKQNRRVVVRSASLN